MSLDSLNMWNKFDIKLLKFSRIWNEFEICIIFLINLDLKYVISTEIYELKCTEMHWNGPIWAKMDRIEKNGPNKIKVNRIRKNRPKWTER